MELAHSNQQTLFWTIRPVDCGTPLPYSQSSQLYTCVRAENELQPLTATIIEDVHFRIAIFFSSSLEPSRYFL